jgi:midasin
MVWLDKLIWPNFDSSQKFTVSSLHEHVDEVIEMFLLAVQSILKLSTKPDSMEGDPETSDKFIKDGLREIESINASLHLEKVLKQLNTILNDCSSAPEQDVKDAVACFLPFLERYLNLVDDQLLNHGRWTGAMFKLDYILCSVLKTVATPKIK